MDMGSPNHRRRSNVKSALIGWAHTHNDICIDNTRWVEYMFKWASDTKVKSCQKGTHVTQDLLVTPCLLLRIWELIYARVISWSWQWCPYVWWGSLEWRGVSQSDILWSRSRSRGKGLKFKSPHCEENQGTEALRSPLWRHQWRQTWNT